MLCAMQHRRTQNTAKKPGFKKMVNIDHIKTIYLFNSYFKK